MTDVMQPDQCDDMTARPLMVPEIVSLPTELDIASGEAVGEQLLARFRPGIRVVIADMSTTKFADSAAIRHLIIAHNHAECTGAELRVVVASVAVRRTLQDLGADQMLQLYTDLTCALTGAPDSN